MLAAFLGKFAQEGVGIPGAVLAEADDGVGGAVEGKVVFEGERVGVERRTPGGDVVRATGECAAACALGLCGLEAESDGGEGEKKGAAGDHVMAPWCVFFNLRSFRPMSSRWTAMSDCVIGLCFPVTFLTRAGMFQEFS